MRHRIAIVLAYLAFVAALARGVWRVGMGTAQGQLARRGESDLALAADRLTSALQRYRQLAVVMADHPDLAPLLSGQAMQRAPAPCWSALQTRPGRWTFCWSMRQGASLSPPAIPRPPPMRANRR